MSYLFALQQLPVMMVQVGLYLCWGRGCKRLGAGGWLAQGLAEGFLA